MPCTGGFGIEYQHIWELMACNEVLIPPPAKVPPSPSSSIFLLLPSNWKWLLLDFSHIATSNKHMFTFLKLLQVIKCRHNWFLKKLKHYIKETRFYHHAMGACPGTRNTDIFSLITDKFSSFFCYYGKDETIHQAFLSFIQFQSVVCTMNLENFPFHESSHHIKAPLYFPKFCIHTY